MDNPDALKVKSESQSPERQESLQVPVNEEQKPESQSQPMTTEEQDTGVTADYVGPRSVDVPAKRAHSEFLDDFDLQPLERGYSKKGQKY